MTRINAGIPVRCLTDEHLLAEHREIKRLPWCLDAAIKSGSINHIPKKFTLGKGHVLFFLDKMKYTFNRQLTIFHELRRRGFNVAYHGDNWLRVYLHKEDYDKDYEPTDECKALLIERISTRIRESKKEVWHYYGKPISKDEAIDLLKRI